MLSNGFVFIFVDVTFVSVYSFSDAVSSFSNILGQSKPESRYTTFDEVHVNLSRMVNLQLLGPVTMLSVLMCEQSWHLGILQGKVPG